MFSEKLLLLLRRFSKYELNRFRKFLLSPYFNDQGDVSRLFEICNTALRQPDLDLSGLTKPWIWKQLYPGKDMDDAHLRRLASDLTQLAIRFMGFERYTRRPADEWLTQYEALEDPALSKHRAGTERALERHWEQEGDRSAEYYYGKFRLYRSNTRRAAITMVGAEFINDLEQADFNLECHYLIQKLWIYTTWLNFRGFRTTERELSVPPGFFEYVSNERFDNEPLIKIYYAVIRCFTELDDEAHYRALLALLERYGPGLSRDDLRECYHLAQNYCALKINQGKAEYYREMFEIFRRTIEQNILLEEGQLSEGVFKNIVTVSLVVDEFDWCRAFIQQYADYLPTGIRENAKTYNLSNLYFHQKQYSQVIELLRGVEYSDVVYALGSKIMLLRTYYESGEYLAIDSLIDSFRIYLRRNKVISKGLKREYINFLNFLKKLTMLEGAAPAAIAGFRKRVSENQSVPAKKWLLEKINELRTG
jgi:hypothetical protein